MSKGPGNGRKPKFMRKKGRKTSSPKCKNKGCSTGRRNRGGANIKIKKSGKIKRR